MATETTMKKAEPSTPEKMHARAVVSPRVDVYENNDEVLIVADVPGVAKDTLKIHLDHDVLRLEAPTAAKPPEGARGIWEFRAADYERTFRIPPGVDTEKVSAELKNGVLHVHLPKAEKMKPRQIAVKSA